MLECMTICISVCSSVCYRDMTNMIFLIVIERYMTRCVCVYVFVCEGVCGQT